MDLAALVRGEELEGIQALLSKGLRNQALKNLDERGGAQDLVRQQYSGRYPFELLQNADDAAREKGTRGRARFILTESALLVADNGLGFDEAQVRSICSLGRSPKGPGTSIGHKGLGFKSVGEISDQPQIISPQARFQFDALRLQSDLQDVFDGHLPSRQRFPSYAFPYPLDAADLGPDVDTVEELHAAGFSTIIRLPLRNDVDRTAVAKHLVTNLQPRLLLFLPNIDHLELRGTDNDFSIDVVRENADGAERVWFDNDSIEEEWLIYRSAFAPSRDALEAMGEAWLKLEQVGFAIAVPLDPQMPSALPLIDETFPLHVFFPTEERPGLHVAIHAEWALTMDRRQIARTREAAQFNDEICSAVIDFVSDTVARDLVDRCGLSTESVEALMPAFNLRQLDGTVEEFVKYWYSKLSRVHFLPLVDKRLGRPVDVVLLPETVEDLAAAHTLAELPNGQTLRPDLEAVDAVRQFVQRVSEQNRMTEAEFLAVLRVPTSETLGDFYTFVVEWALWSNVLEELQSFPCVLTTSGDAVAVADETVFFSRRGTTLPANIPVPVAEVPDVRGAENFLRQLGVKDFDWRDIIREYLVPILEDETADSADRERALELLRTYQSVRKTAGDVPSGILSRVLVPARNRDSTEIGFRPAGEVYFGHEWTGQADLEEIYGPFNEVEFLAAEVPDRANELSGEQDFYRMLGVSDHPRLDQAGSYVLGGSRHPHLKVGKVFSEWLLEVDAWSCPDRHDKTQQLATSYYLDRFELIAQSRDPRRLIFLWNQFALNWNKFYEHGLRSEIVCPHAWHRGHGGRSIDSLFAYMLHSFPWVPVELAGEPTVATPTEAWVATPETPSRVLERIPRISETMYRSRGGPNLVAELGLIEASRPSVPDLLGVLDSLAAEGESSEAVSRDVVLAARWVQRKLNDGLGVDADPHPEPDKVRVLASYAGRAVFAVRPPFAEDALLRETWQSECPVLSADAGSGRLIEFLDLVKLDDAVETVPEPRGRRSEDHVQATRRHIDSTKPFILALVRSEIFSAERRVARALRHLEVVVCERLVLLYRYDGTEIRRDDAACYIATRQEDAGSWFGNVGTAYIEFDRNANEPDWFAVGRQLAQYLGIASHADAITMLLKVDAADRTKMMQDRQIPVSFVDEARESLDVALEFEESVASVLDTYLSPAADAEVVLSGVELATSSEIEDDAAATITSLEDDTSSTPVSQEVPPVDYAAVRVIDAAPGDVEQSNTRRAPRKPNANGSSSAPPLWTEVEKRRIGKRGEEIAYHAECKRLLEIGLNPESVVWQSKLDELSPIDMRSIDSDSQLIFIEVKATTASDPSEPFYMSPAELWEAIAHGSRYYIYRVTDVDTAEPQVIRWSDPVALVRDGKGKLDIATAKMQLGLGSD